VGQQSHNHQQGQYWPYPYQISNSGGASAAAASTLVPRASPSYYSQQQQQTTGNHSSSTFQAAAPNQNWPPPRGYYAQRAIAQQQPQQQQPSMSSNSGQLKRPQLSPNAQQQTTQISSIYRPPLPANYHHYPYYAMGYYAGSVRYPYPSAAVYSQEYYRQRYQAINGNANLYYSGYPTSSSDLYGLIEKKPKIT
jgi:hypothetical protein